MMTMTLFPPILYAPQFSRDDVLAVTGISSGVLKGILDRKQVTLRSEHNPGTGKRRMFTGGDILKITTANIASNIGFPLRWAHILADRVEQRAIGKVTGTALEPCNHFGMAFYPNKDGTDWAFVPIFDGKEASPLPIACQVIDVDRLIDETLAKLTAIVNEEPIPSFDILEAPQPDPLSPEADYFGIWTKDENGQPVIIGLTTEETKEYRRLYPFFLADQAGQSAMSQEDKAAFDLLDQKHHRAHDMARFGVALDDEDDE